MNIIPLKNLINFPENDFANVSEKSIFYFAKADQ